MGLNDQALLHVRAGLCGRIDRIAAGIADQPRSLLCDQVDAVRRIAREHGLNPVAQLAGALEAALATGDRGAMIATYLDILREAVGCERLDSAAGEAFLAAVSVRLAG